MHSPLQLQRIRVRLCLLRALKPKKIGVYIIIDTVATTVAVNTLFNNIKKNLSFVSKAMNPKSQVRDVSKEAN